MSRSCIRRTALTAGAKRGAAGNICPAQRTSTMSGALAAFAPVLTVVNSRKSRFEVCFSTFSLLPAWLSRNSSASGHPICSGLCVSQIVRHHSSYAETSALATPILIKHVRAAKQDSHPTRVAVILMASHWPPELCSSFPVVACSVRSLLLQAARRDLFRCCSFCALEPLWSSSYPHPLPAMP